MGNYKMTGNYKSNPGVFFHVVKKVDETVNNSVTFQDDDEIVCTTLKANRIYSFLLVMIFISLTTADIKYKITGNTIVRQIGNLSGNAVSTVEAGTDARSYNTDGTTNMGILHGSIVTDGSPVAFQLQWAQNAAVATDTKMLKGSYLVIWEET